MRSAIDVEEILPAELARQIQGGDAVQILDVRAPFRLADGRIDLVPPHRFHNIVGSKVRSMQSLDGTGIDPSLPIVVVCGHGNDSRFTAAHLGDLGYRALSLKGGMAAWMHVVLPRPLISPLSLDRFLQFDRPGKGSLGYVLVSDGEAFIIDPPRDATALVDEVRALDATIIGVADTHVHADYISGAPAIARMFGVPYYLHPRDAVSPFDGRPAEMLFDGIEDGDAIRVGRSAVRVMHAPGHTEGSVCFLVDDEVAMTGDFVFVQSVGRPDIAGKTAEWTADLWRSLRTARRGWPADLAIYPAHYTSEEERRADGVIAARFGDVIEQSEAFRAAEDRGSFEQWVRTRTNTVPDVYRRIKAVNLGLEVVDDREAEELEAGRNQCALG